MEFYEIPRFWAKSALLAPREHPEGVKTVTFITTFGLGPLLGHFGSKSGKSAESVKSSVVKPGVRNIGPGAAPRRAATGRPARGGGLSSSPGIANTLADGRHARYAVGGMQRRPSVKYAVGTWRCAPPLQFICVFIYLFIYRGLPIVGFAHRDLNINN